MRDTTTRPRLFDGRRYAALALVPLVLSFAAVRWLDQHAAPDTPATPATPAENNTPILLNSWSGPASPSVDGLAVVEGGRWVAWKEAYGTPRLLDTVEGTVQTIDDPAWPSVAVVHWQGGDLLVSVRSYAMYGNPVGVWRVDPATLERERVVDGLNIAGVRDDGQWVVKYSAHYALWLATYDPVTGNLSIIRPWPGLTVRRVTGTGVVFWQDTADWSARYVNTFTAEEGVVPCWRDAVVGRLLVSPRGVFGYASVTRGDRNGYDGWDEAGCCKWPGPGLGYVDSVSDGGVAVIRGEDAPNGLQSLRTGWAWSIGGPRSLHSVAWDADTLYAIVRDAVGSPWRIEHWRLP